MSFDLAFWENDGDATDAAERFERFAATYLEAGVEAPITPRLRAFLDAARERFPDDPSDARIDDVIWASMPIDPPMGPFAYVNLRWSVDPSSIETLVRLAAAHGLVVFDPQSGSRVTPD